ncbi:MAG: hypothetical protein FJ014_17070 [Chloroflexi bacterium]|nr:hypothetical protein [Chloroflexota bacterium]
MNDPTMTNIDLFFEDPAIYHAPPRSYSVLYLLRRDISVCLGIDPNSGNPINFQALLPGAMAILAGIDLLGKFLAGNDNIGEVGKRFKDFVSKYLQAVSPTDATILYQLRNSLLHSFGLYSEDRKGNVYKFTLSATQRPLVQPLGSDNYLVDVRTLRSQFETGIANYQADLKSDLSLQTCFNAMFSKYGAVCIG